MTAAGAKVVRRMLQRTEAYTRDREIEFTVRHSSRNRCWTGLTATLYDASSGIDETLFSSHSISMHVGAPVGITTRCDGLVSHRMQRPGDLKVVPAGYSRVWEVEAPTTKLTMNLSASLVRLAAEELGMRAGGIAITPQLHVRDPQIEHIAWAIKAELETSTPAGRLYADSLGLALAAHLLRRYASGGRQREARGLSERRVRRVVEYIHEHLAQDLALTELAELANVSQSHFKVLFKRALGVPVHDYVIRARVDYALGLLLKDDVALSEIALRAGFANQSHMALWVRRITGKSPGSLRKA